MRHEPLELIGRSLSMSFFMFWQMFWALILGFSISAGVQAVISKGEMQRILPNAKPLTLLKACGLGAVSSSCSYASVAIARSIFQKGADFTASIAFEFASTNLVIELGIILALLIGWQFTAAEFVGGLVMIFVLALLFRFLLPDSLVRRAKVQALKGESGKMEGHAAMEMSVDAKQGGILKRLMSTQGLTAVSHYFVMDVAMVWKDIAGGLLISDALAVCVPESFWRHFFLSGQSGTVPKVWDAAIGPLVSMASFVCSVGNVPLAAVLWNGGISFGGVIAFLFADLLIFPILNIYRKYYGWRMTAFLFATFYFAMVLAALLIEEIFGVLHLVPAAHMVLATKAAIRFDHTTILNILLGAAAAWLIVHFYKTGGHEMLMGND